MRCNVLVGSVLKYFLFLRRLSAHYLSIFKLFDGFTAQSYALEPDHIKSFSEKVMDYLYLFFILNVLPKNYHLFRFDVKPRNEFKQYMDDPDAPLLRPRLWESLWPSRYFSLVHDKYLFHCYCDYHHLPVSGMYGLYPDGLMEKQNERGLGEIMDTHELDRVVLKPVLGLMGKKIRIITRAEADAFVPESFPTDQLALFDTYEEHQFILQEVIQQHPDINRINPHSVNSIRIISILNLDGTVDVLAAMLRVSASESPIDNFSQGGIVIGIHLDTGKLKEEGFMHPRSGGTTVKEHPLTHVVFKDVQLPFWDEVIRLTKSAQKIFHFIKAVGWDLAITPEGPVIIEGNQEWGTAGLQAANGGLLTPTNKERLAQYGLHFY